MCPRFGRGRHEKNPTWDIFDQTPGEMSLIRGKLANHVVGDHVVPSLEGADLMRPPGMESSNPPAIC